MTAQVSSRQNRLLLSRLVPFELMLETRAVFLATLVLYMIYISSTAFVLPIKIKQSVIFFSLYFL